MTIRALDDITEGIIDAAIHIHRDLGPGLLESVYEAVLARALERRGFRVERQTAVRFEYDGMIFEDGFRTDLIVEDQVIVELKSVERLAPVHSKKLLTYVRLMNKRVGLLINFGGNTLTEGLRRVVNDLPPSASPRLRVNQLALKTGGYIGSVKPAVNDGLSRGGAGGAEERQVERENCENSEN